MCTKSSPTLCRVGKRGYVAWQGWDTWTRLRRWLSNPFDNILILPTTYIDAGVLLDDLVVCLSRSASSWTQTKTKVMTTETQPPTFLSTRAGFKIEVVEHKWCHKWFGCMLNMPTVIKKRHVVENHLQAAWKAFLCHRATLCVIETFQLEKGHGILTSGCFCCGTPNDL